MSVIVCFINRPLFIVIYLYYSICWCKYICIQLWVYFYRYSWRDRSPYIGENAHPGAQHAAVLYSTTTLLMILIYLTPSVLWCSWPQDWKIITFGGTVVFSRQDPPVNHLFLQVPPVHRLGALPHTRPLNPWVNVFCSVLTSLPVEIWGKTTSVGASWLYRTFQHEGLDWWEPTLHSL